MIFNPTAGGRRRKRLRRALARLEAHGLAPLLLETTAPGDAEAFARAADGVDIVAVAGGDGTVNEAANGLLARAEPPALAIIPLGTANVLAAEIGFIDISPETAADAIAKGDVRPAYVGVANGRVFCQMAGVGFDADVVAGVDARVKRLVGKTAYGLESFRRFLAYRRRFFTVEIDGRPTTASSAIVANGHFYGGRFVCAPAADIDQPEFQVCLFRRAGRLHVLRYALGLATGRLDRYRDVDIVPARRLTVRAADDEPGDGPIQGDGDVIAELPATIDIAARRLPIVRP